MSEERCRSLEAMFSATFNAKPRRKKAKPKPMFPSPEAKAAFMAKRKAEDASRMTKLKQAYESYIAECRSDGEVMKFKEWRASKG
tara:strand:+ start:937 stop:1191 length:255 start_codon:yes stop_codon:yes gene_type:complete